MNEPISDTNAANPIQNRRSEDRRKDKYSVDHRDIYFKGFMTLPEEEKSKILTWFLMNHKNTDAIKSIDIKDQISIANTELEIWREKEEQKNVKLLTYGGLTIFSVLLIFFIFQIYNTDFLTDKESANMFLNLLSKIADLFLKPLPPPPEV